MAEESPKRPNGGREGDFGELNDWTIMDIATTPKTSPEDRQNAEAEIARREEAGNFNPDEAPQEVRSDLLSHGYGVEDGKVLYPTPEYKDWLESDRSTPPPHDPIKETITDRLRDERDKTEFESKQRVGQEAIEAYNEEYEDAPHMVKVNISSKPTTEKDEIKREREADKKAADIEIALRRKMKELNKYDNPLVDSERSRASEAEANLPIVEVSNESNERIHNPEFVEAKKESWLGKNADRALDYAIRKAKKTPIDDLYTEGALDHIADGDFSFNPNFIQDGFSTYYRAEIDRRAGATKDIVWDAIKYDGILPKVENIKQLEELENKAVRTAVEIGATRVRDGKTGEEHVEFALPLRKLGDEKVDEIIAKFGIKYDGLPENIDENVTESDKEANRIYESFESGFVNIVDALKDDRESKEGFKELDWYFSHLLVGLPEEKIAERVIGLYEAAENDAFINKFNQFISWRDEINAKITTAVGEKVSDESADEDVAIVEFADENNVESSLEEEIIFPVVGMGTERHPRGGHARKNPDDYGVRKERAFNAQMKIIEQIPGFEAGEPYVTVSKPFYMRNIYKEVTDEFGGKAKVLDRTLVRGAHFDQQKGAYVSDTTGNEIDPQCIRQYKSIYFSINDVPISIKESITNMSGSMYIVFDEDALSPNQGVFHGSINEAINTIRGQGRKIIKKNHCQYIENGVKGYHSFGKMWQKAMQEILEHVNSKAG